GPDSGDLRTGGRRQYPDHPLLGAVVELAPPAAEPHDRRFGDGRAVPLGPARRRARFFAAVRRRRPGAHARPSGHGAGRGTAAPQGVGGVMREALDQWTFVVAAYAVTVIGTLLLVGWSWLAMRTAERKREEGRRK